jgi:uncharacterized membrane protein required for colicin V production
MVIDVLVAIFVGVLTYIDTKRGFFRALVDMIGVIIAFKITIFLHPKFSLWFVNTLHFSPKISALISCLFLFFGIFGLFFGIGAVIYSMTLLTLAPVFEEIFSAICAFITACGILRFILILIVSLSANEALKSAIHNSLFAEELLTLSWYHFIMKKLEPLTNPGKLYL